ncbi:MAG TPA: rhodanese-like domain-containing protein [Rhodothermales bacterium]|nr:rhodanese-like domain-containing protein [Rhodothermales bacterium]
MVYLYTFTLTFINTMSIFDWFKTKEPPSKPKNLKLTVFRVKEVSVHDAYELLRSGTILFDIREEFDRKSHGEIQGARALPLREISPKRLPLNTNTPIMFICQTGSRAGSAARQAVAWGYSNVMSVQGGLQRWKRANLPVAL